MRLISSVISSAMLMLTTMRLRGLQDRCQWQRRRGCRGLFLSFVYSLRLGVYAPLGWLKLKLLMLCEVVLHCVLTTNNVLNTSIAMFFKKRKMVFCIREMLLDLFKTHVRAINQTQQPCVVCNNCGYGSNFIHFASPKRPCAKLLGHECIVKLTKQIVNGFL